MKHNEDTFVYKPTLLRVIIENSIAFAVLLLILSLASKTGSFLKDALGALIAFVIIFIHNSYLMKPALLKQKWFSYAWKATLYILVICPSFFLIDEIIENFVNKKPIPNFIQFFASSAIASLVLIFCGGCVYLFKYFAIERQLRLKSELQLKKKQLLLLQSQLNPHFLFNALNSIKALTISDPEKARDAIVLLSELLRKSLNTTTEIFIKIDEEIATVKDYLELEKMRYSDRLTYELVIENESKNALVPSMSLQLMVENAIKHGINQLMEGGKINIHVYEKEKKMYIEVRNPGQLKTKKSESGIGTQNIIENLKLLYGDEGHFSIVNENSQTVLAQLIIPIKYEQL